MQIDRNSNLRVILEGSKWHDRFKIDCFEPGKCQTCPKCRRSEDQKLPMYALTISAATMMALAPPLSSYITPNPLPERSTSYLYPAIAPFIQPIGTF